MKVYLLCEDVDLGYHVVDVYSSLDKIPFELTPTMMYQYLGTPKEIKHIVPGCWNVLPVDDRPRMSVCEYEVK